MTEVFPEDPAFPQLSRRSLRASIPILFCLLFIFPPMVIAESRANTEFMAITEFNDLKEGEVCRRDLLKDKKGWSDKGNWKKCIQLMFIFPPMVITESSDLKEADVCRRDLLKDKKGWKDRSRWKKCIKLYKETSTYKEGQGRAAYEIASLYHYRASSTAQINIKDLEKAKRYYKKAIRQNRMEPDLISDTKQLLRILESGLKDAVKGTPDITSDTFPIDSDASPPLHHGVTSQFSWGAKLNFESRVRDNRDLDDEEDDRDLNANGSLTIAGLLLSAPRDLEPRFELFGEIQIEHKVQHKEGRDNIKDETSLDFKKGYITWRNFIFPTMHLQIGRQKFKDLREWVYDESLDAIRIFYKNDGLELQLSYSSNFFDPEDSEDQIKNLIFYSLYPLWKKNITTAYVINRRGRFDENDPDFDLTFLGLSLKGKAIKNQQYWLETAVVLGDEGGKRVLGYGFDLGWISRFKSTYKPALTMAYAFGSGDSNPGDTRDKNFRQTGLQDNDTKLGGIIKIKQYGELFEPELSNLSIITLGFGFSLGKKGSIDLVYHHYIQVQTHEKEDNDLRDDGIKEDPDELSQNLGDEVDLVLGWSITKRLKVGMIMAFFSPGPAYSNRDGSFLGKIEMGYTL